MDPSFSLIGQSIICFSSVDWGSNPQGAQRIMQILARQGNRVLFVETTGMRVPNWRDWGRIRNRLKIWRAGREGFREIEPRLYTYSPVVIPMPYSRLALLLNRRLFIATLHQWMRIMQFDSPIIWAFLPTGLTQEFIRRTSHRLVVYSCVEPPPTSLPVARKFAKAQRQLLARADLVFAASRALQSECARHHSRVHTFGFGMEGSWEARIEEMACLIQGEIELRRFEREAHWQERWVARIQQVTRRALRWGALAILGYALVFHTPLVWWLARPLKVVDEPRPADAIVVLAGGVGESGQPGQGYEERVAYAVDLYKSNLAPQIVLASGYTYRFQETQVMRALARSLGVPDDVILLEPRGRNTYEQAREVVAVLHQRRARSALLVSSPYHMRRALLVFQRQGEEIRWISTPVTHSLFYGQEGRVAWQHLRALLHECLAIAYYRVRGWL